MALRPSLAVLATGLLLLAPAGILAQTSDAVCLSSFNWMDNSKNQSPCLLGAYLQGACNGGQFNVGQLPLGSHYTGPYADQQNQCQCSSVTYNALSACGLCQNRTIISWSVWDANCSIIYPGVFPPGVPDGTAVPQWAFQDVTTSDLFNVTLAQSVGDNPESTATSAPSTGILGATSTGVSASVTPITSSSSSASPGNRSDAGAIAGGVVGGVVGVALIAGVVIFFLMRKRRSPVPPAPLSAQYAASPTLAPASELSDSAAFTPPMAQPRLYDPSDPSTFPSSPLSAAITSGQPNVHGSVASYPAANYSAHSVQPGGHYSGVPEI